MRKNLCPGILAGYGNAARFQMGTATRASQRPVSPKQTNVDLLGNLFDEATLTATPLNVSQDIRIYAVREHAYDFN